MQEGSAEPLVGQRHVFRSLRWRSAPQPSRGRLLVAPVTEELDREHKDFKRSADENDREYGPGDR